MERELWKLVNLSDIGHEPTNDIMQFGLCGTPNAGNCSGAGNENTIGRIGSPAVDLIYRVNPPSDRYTTEEKMKWYAAEREGWIVTTTNRETAPWRQHSIAIGSNDIHVEGLFNIVSLMDEYKGFRLVETIPALGFPYQDAVLGTTVMNDYAGLSPETTPWYFHEVWVAVQKGIVRMTPKGKVIMPLFGPWGFPHPDSTSTGLWIHPKYLAERFYLTPPPPPVGSPILNHINVTVSGVTYTGGPSTLSIP